MNKNNDKKKNINVIYIFLDDRWKVHRNLHIIMNLSTYTEKAFLRQSPSTESLQPSLTTTSPGPP